MLYDPKWEKKTGDLTIPNLIAWLETQPPETVYDYCRPSTCLVAEFLKVHGAAHFVLPTEKIPNEILGILRGPNFQETYGAALARARALTSPEQTKP